jgi:radical SAM protein with 4Fe4S-binding SPASM domain
LSEIIDIVKSTGVYVGLSTNGLLINEQIEALSKLDYITFSLDSIDNYDDIRISKKKQYDLIGNILSFLPIAYKNKIAIDIQLIELEGWQEQLRKVKEIFSLETVTVRTMPNGYYCYQFPDLKNTCTDLCINPWLSASISCNGNVSACCISTGDDIQLGNIKDQTLKEIWAGSEIEKLREEHMSRNYREVCRKCYMRSPFLCHESFLFNSIRNRKRQ